MFINNIEYLYSVKLLDPNYLTQWQRMCHDFNFKYWSEVIEWIKNSYPDGNVTVNGTHTIFFFKTEEDKIEFILKWL